MASQWSSKKHAAIDAAKSVLSSGDVSVPEAVKSVSEAASVTQKHAIKAVYAAAVEGGYTLSNGWKDNSIISTGEA